MQRSGWYTVLGAWFQLSGLWHHQQESGHPFKNTVVRMPGPSCVENRMMLKMYPVFDSSEGWMGVGSLFPATEGRLEFIYFNHQKGLVV
jgi:hypothetical protein